ncbi:MAG: sporulation integral membrane protein YtvI [Clostridia bacterium]|nr:sporulation integral membrane protein YtvI [Clostridia bacterium]
MNKEKLELWANAIIVALGGIVLSYLALTHLLNIALPFFFSWGVAFCVRPISHKIASRVKIPHKIVSLLLTLIVVFAGLGALVGILIYAGREAWNFLSGLAEDERIYEIIEKLLNPLSGIFGESETALLIEERIAEAVKSLLSGVLSGFVNVVTGIASSVPGILIFLLTTLISAIYFSLDLDNINRKVRSTLPEKLSSKLVNFKNKFLITALRYMRSYLIIMLVVFFILLIGFLILGVKYAILLAVIFALLDMLPLIGIGAFMLPWGIFEMIFGSFGLGVGILVLFAITEIIRNLIEPKIVGKNLGIHPILTLVLIYASYSLFGIFGLLLIPFLTVILNIAIDKNNSPKVEEGKSSE